jgi:heme-degrading monooxygenase HmoA
VKRSDFCHMEAVAPSVPASVITVPEAGREAVVAAFGRRLGAVDSWPPGFQGLQVWADPTDPTVLLMVSWWDTEEAFAAYMGSSDHRRSHKQIPRGVNRPGPGRFRRYQVIAR